MIFFNSTADRLITDKNNVMRAFMVKDTHSFLLSNECETVLLHKNKYKYFVKEIYKIKYKIF